MQIKAYGPSTTYDGCGLKPRRLLVWEGRRKGCPGVGWGTGALIAEGVGAGMSCLISLFTVVAVAVCAVLGGGLGSFCFLRSSCCVCF